jgi:hypothetical protein
MIDLMHQKVILVIDDFVMAAMYKKVHDNYLYACLVNLGPQLSQNGGVGTNYLLPV